jgi:hypothetical protein
MTKSLSYSVSKGLPWERLIIVRDRRTHRIVKPLEARGYIKTSVNGRVPFDIQITAEGGILISLTDEATSDLPTGDLEFDVVATTPLRRIYSEGPTEITQPVAKGTLSVTGLDNITPLEDTQAMEIRFKQRVDFRRTFTWRDSTDTLISVQNAYMQAKDSAGATVLDLRWYSTKPSEETIVALTANRRGYLAPIAGGTLEMHVSDKNTVPAGAYPFDMFVQDSAGDWDCLASGTVVVEAAVSAPPT